MPLVFAILIVAFFISSANAYMQTHSRLNVSVSCDHEVINPGQTVTITCTANMEGKGIVFVIQPVKGSSPASSQSGDVQEDLNKISSDTDGSLWKIISYAWVRITDPEGGEQEFTFPDEFTGLNGEPGTNIPGKYYVFFVFLHLCVCKIGFDCSSFFVVPELPIGTLMATTASLGALLGNVAVKRLRTKPRLPTSSLKSQSNIIIRTALR